MERDALLVDHTFGHPSVPTLLLWFEMKAERFYYIVSFHSVILYIVHEIEGDYKYHRLIYVAPANLDQFVVGVGIS